MLSYLRGDNLPRCPWLRVERAFDAIHQRGVIVTLLRKFSLQSSLTRTHPTGNYVAGEGA